jgi:hypothetical protein
MSDPKGCKHAVLTGPNVTLVFDTQENANAWFIAFNNAFEESPKHSTLGKLREDLNRRAVKREEMLAKNICPECTGSGVIGGQFTGGEFPCSDCDGTGKYDKERA